MPPCEVSWWGSTQNLQCGEEVHKYDVLGRGQWTYLDTCAGYKRASAWWPLYRPCRHWWVGGCYRLGSWRRCRPHMTWCTGSMPTTDSSRRQLQKSSRRSLSTFGVRGPLKYLSDPDSIPFSRGGRDDRLPSFPFLRYHVVWWKRFAFCSHVGWEWDGVAPSVLCLLVWISETTVAKRQQLCLWTKALLLVNTY